ncbi:restriction endonuclease subunit S [Halomonas sp. PGE1]|uniref:restriction endonuclease subunit S n=1 Tax=Halomonas sp. PGE1 TaxID=2730360 RepID=UPI001473B683|nr:restriction endonuclease subunit S [Halomonas sp. PGE1]QJQ99696.1 restriction endonuclease subunit S [Halomonas sp. PGE1]
MTDEAMEVRDASAGYALQADRPMVPEGYRDTEIGIIPEDWEVSAVRQKGEVLAGKALAVNAPGEQRPYLRTKNVLDGRIDTADVLKMPMTDEQFRQFQIRNGDVLLNEGQSLGLVGRCAIYKDEYPEPCAIQNALLRFRARSGICENFAAYLFRHCQQTGIFSRISLQTTSVAHLGSTRFGRLRLAWPTEVEQRAIATALSDADELLETLDRLIAKKRDIKQATMQQLLTGETRLPGFVGEWEEKEFDEVLERINGKRHQVQASDYQSIGIYPVIDQGKEAVVGFSDASDRLFECPYGGVIIFGDHTCIVKFVNYDFIIGADGTQVVKAKKGQITRFYAYCLQYSGVEQTGYNRHFKHLRDKRFVVPSGEEQIAIASALSALDNEIEALEKRRAKTVALKQAMMQELLTGRTRLI